MGRQPEQSYHLQLWLRLQELLQVWWLYGEKPCLRPVRQRGEDWMMDLELVQPTQQGELLPPQGAGDLGALVGACFWER